MAKKRSWFRQIMADALPYSYYGYGVYSAAAQAKLLGLSRISVIEFGVAGGNGLLALRGHADYCQRKFGVIIDVYGFDTGEGMTPASDYRDMPYRFAPGNYKMDVPALRLRIGDRNIKLILGDVAKTANSFVRTHDPAPIGFVSFDMDYYSSTIDAFRIFRPSNFYEHGREQHFLPRIQCYFDDVTGTTISSYNEFVGELAAIATFNRRNRNVKIGKSQVFHTIRRDLEWHHQFYVMHRFRNPHYATYISSASPNSLSLTPHQPEDRLPIHK